MSLNVIIITAFMIPLNQKKRLISIFQFLGLYVLGFLLMGFAINSFSGVETKEKEALDKQIKKLEGQIRVKDSLMEVEKRRWEELRQNAQIADSFTTTLQKLEDELSKALALGAAGNNTAGDRRDDIAGVERKIRYELKNLNGIPEGSLQDTIRKHMASGFNKMLVAKNSLRALQANILKEDADNEVLVENANLKTELNQLKSSQAAGNKLNNCELNLGNKKQKIEDFAGTVKEETKLISGLIKDLEEIQEDIKSFLGNDKGVKNKLSNKIDDLEQVADRLSTLEEQMKSAAK